MKPLFSTKPKVIDNPFIDCENLQKRSVADVEFFYCPVCDNLFEGSEYLKENIQNKKTLWIANMVTHHRHVHIKSYEESYKNIYYNKYYNPIFHEEFRKKQNERSKRQILRKCKEFLYEHEFKKFDFLQLQENEEKTIELINKVLKD